MFDAPDFIILFIVFVLWLIIWQREARPTIEAHQKESQMPEETPIAEAITITQADLTKVFTTWENNFRSGKVKYTPEQARALPPEKVAAESADWVFANLKQLRKQ